MMMRRHWANQGEQLVATKGHFDSIHLGLSDGKGLLEDDDGDARGGGEESRGNEREAGVLGVEGGEREGGAGGVEAELEVDEAAWKNEEVTGIEGGREVVATSVNKAHENGPLVDHDDLGGAGMDMRGDKAARLGIVNLNQS
ncbi:hypothetical protein GOP47_0024245 [Adiantum capillus-veneris]|uniref:Uncharacterized protein n=1 Tax=Adiantum capillus-veneris TaxID=13818 RepID=A0A9D4U614_ADICA|nr:hypothetical protein GOP47_0024245 [Adiantum capillus-veneris]